MEKNFNGMYNVVMKILFYRYNSICEPDMIEAFEELGHSVYEITEEMTNKNVLPSECVKLVSQQLMQNPCDIVFSINFYPAISDVCEIFHIPYFCMVVDSPILELYSKSIKNKCNRVFIFDNTTFNEISVLNPKCVFYLPLAANVKKMQKAITTYQQNSASPIFSESPKSDISFIGSLYTEKNPYDSLVGTSDFFNGFMDALINAQLGIYGSYFIENALTLEIISEFKKCMPSFYNAPEQSFLADKTTIAQYYLGYKITSVERINLLGQISEKYGLDMYTGSDTSFLSYINNKGFAKTQTQMPVIFHESKINLNITARSIRSGLPQRIWDVFACEGFLISNYQSEIPQYFVPGEDIILFDSPESLMELIEYYLHHDNERKVIAHNAFEKVCAYHTYVHRAELMLENV